MHRWGRTTLFSVMRDPGFISAPMNMNEHPVVTIMNHPLLGPAQFPHNAGSCCKVCGCSSVVTLQYKYNATIPMHCTVKQICNMQEGDTTLSTQTAHEHIQLQLLQCSKCADRSLNLDGIQLVQRRHARQRRQRRQQRFIKSFVDIYFIYSHAQTPSILQMQNQHTLQIVPI